jgi:predicted dehydrogenase
MKIGIVGAGFMGNMHANLISNIKDVELVGVASKTRKSAEAISNRLHIKCYSDYREIASDGAIDIIDICSPTDSHANIAIESMKNGKHVIIEYPAASNFKEVLRLKRASDETGMNCMLAYTSRFQSHYKYVFDCARSGELGEIRGLFISRKSSDVFSSSDIVNNLISQDIDYMVALLGVPQSFSCAHHEQDYECFSFRYETLIAVIEGATNMHGKYPFSTRHSISGSQKSIDLQWQFIDHPEYSLIKTSPDGQEEIKIEDFDPYQRELEEIFCYIKHGKTKGADID